MGSTVPSPENPMENARMLMGRKDRIQEELDAQLSVLKSQSCTMSTPLVDAQGFPRADIDVYAVRQARVRIIELRNDLVDVTDKIKLALEVLHSEPQPESVPNQIQTQTPSSSVESDQDDTQIKPFARVDGVMPGSPSADAGLRREDLLLRFGHLKASSFSGTSLQPLAEFVSQQENRQLTVKVRRGGEDISLSFTPRSGWGGRGMLGQVIPEDSSNQTDSI